MVMRQARQQQQKACFSVLITEQLKSIWKICSEKQQPIGDGSSGGIEETERRRQNEPIRMPHIIRNTEVLSVRVGGLCAHGRHGRPRRFAR